MPIGPELKKLLDGLKAHDNKNEIFVAIKDDPDYVDLKNSIYQVAFNDGHKTATEDHRGAKTRFETKISELEGEKTQLETQLQNLKKNNPDTASLHAEYGNKIAAKDQEIAKLKNEWLGEKKERKQRDVRDALVKELKTLRVDEHKAEAMGDAYMKQVSVSDDLSSRILQRGQSTAYAGDEAAQVKAFAADLFKEVPADLIRSKVVGNGSQSEGESIGSGGGDDKLAVLDRAKKAAQEVGKITKVEGSNLSPQQELQRRLGLRQTT